MTCPKKRTSITANAYNIAKIAVEIITDTDKNGHSHRLPAGHLRYGTCADSCFLRQFALVHALIDQQFPKIVVRNNHGIILIILHTSLCYSTTE